MNFWKLSEIWDGPYNIIYFICSIGFYFFAAVTLEHFGINGIFAIVPLAIFALYRAAHRITKLIIKIRGN